MFSFNQFNFDKNTFIFYNQNTILVRTVPFIKPPDIKFVHILAVGGGGGGGAGTSWVTATTRNGGGGGGGGGVTVGLFPANLLPDTLYVSVGQGGAGATSGPAGATASGAGNNGVNGKNSTIYLVNQPNISASGSILLTAFGGYGGTGGSVLAEGSGGISYPGPTLTDMPMACLGTFTSTPSTKGGSASNGPGGASEPFKYSFVSGGGGGGRSSSSNGSASGGASGLLYNDDGIRIPVISGGSAGNNGQNGIMLFKPYFVSLGGGGGGSDSGNGGNGGIGSGGGGGGGGTKAAIGNAWDAGFGGDGGDGIVIISCW